MHDPIARIISTALLSSARPMHIQVPLAQQCIKAADYLRPIFFSRETTGLTYNYISAACCFPVKIIVV